MKDYLQILKDIFITRQKELETSGEKLSDNHDKFIVWIISLSTGSIALIFSTVNKIDFLSTATIVLPISFFIGSILTGVIGRTLSAISSHIGHQLNSLFAFGLRMMEIPFGSRKLEGNESAEQIYTYFISDFDTEFPDIIKRARILEGKDLDEYNKIARDFYQEYADSRKKDLGFALERINDEMLNSFGLKKDYFEKTKVKSNRLKGIIMRCCNVGHLILYVLSMSSFVTAIIIISIKILKN